MKKHKKLSVPKISTLSRQKKLRGSKVGFGTFFQRKKMGKSFVKLNEGLLESESLLI